MRVTGQRKRDQVVMLSNKVDQLTKNMGNPAKHLQSASSSEPALPRSTSEKNHFGTPRAHFSLPAAYGDTEPTGRNRPNVCTKYTQNMRRCHTRDQSGHAEMRAGALVTYPTGEGVHCGVIKSSLWQWNLRTRS